MNLINDAKIIQLDTQLEMIEEGTVGWWLAGVTLLIAKLNGISHVITNMIVNRPELIQHNKPIDAETVNDVKSHVLSKLTNLKDELDTILHKIHVDGIIPDKHDDISNGVSDIISNVTSDDNFAFVNNPYMINQIRDKLNNMGRVLDRFPEQVPNSVTHALDAAKEKVDEISQFARNGHHDIYQANQPTSNISSQDVLNNTEEYRRELASVNHGVELGLILLGFYIIYKMFSSMSNTSNIKSKMSFKKIIGVGPSIIRSFKKALK